MTAHLEQLLETFIDSTPCPSPPVLDITNIDFIPDLEASSQPTWTVFMNEIARTADMLSNMTTPHLVVIEQAKILAKALLFLAENLQIL